MSKHDNAVVTTRMLPSQKRVVMDAAKAAGVSLNTFCKLTLISRATAAKKQENAPN